MTITMGVTNPSESVSRSPSVDVHLDWLRYSVAWDHGLSEMDNVLDALPPFTFFRLSEAEASIGQGYNRGRELNAGMVFWHSERHEQGVSVQMSGLDLQEARNAGIAELDLLMALQRKNAKITTLHSCINIHNAGARVLDVVEAHDAGLLKTRARQIGVYSSTAKVRQEWKAGDTVYIGSPKSGIQIRIYNKAAEQRTDGDWIRVEIVFRGIYAETAHASMCKYGIPSVTRMAIQKQADFSAAWWVYGMRGGISPSMQVKRKERGTYTWLKNVVVPAWRREIVAESAQNSDAALELLEAFIAEVKR